jgi:hypothetical protein
MLLLHQNILRGFLNQIEKLVFNNMPLFNTQKEPRSTMHFSKLLHGVASADERGRGGSSYKLPAPSPPEGGPGPDFVACVFVFLCSIIICRLYKLTLSHHTQVTLQLRFGLSDLV